MFVPSFVNLGGGFYSPPPPPRLKAKDVCSFLFLRAPLSIHAIFLKYYAYVLYVIYVSAVPLDSGSKLLTCGNGEQWCPLASFTGSIGRILYMGNLVIFKRKLLPEANILSSVKSKLQTDLVLNTVCASISSSNSFSSHDKFLLLCEHSQLKTDLVNLVSPIQPLQYFAMHKRLGVTGNL